MTSFDCPRCWKTFSLERWLILHLKCEHGIAPVLLDPTVAEPSQVTEWDPDMSTPSTPPAQDIIPAAHPCIEPKVNFHMVYDLDQGDEVQPLRMNIPRDESYDKFLQRLRHIFYGDSLERSLRQWEYVLVNRQYEKSDPLPLTSSNTYYAMVSELLRPKSRWRHAIVRRSVRLIQ